MSLDDLSVLKFVYQLWIRLLATHAALKASSTKPRQVITYNFMKMNKKEKKTAKYWTHEMSPLCNVLVQDVTEWMKNHMHMQGKPEANEPFVYLHMVSHVSILAAHLAIEHFCHILLQVKFWIPHYPLYKKGNK
uniref:Uncharacterized protein n=1 Tax=Glossina pallidipes TaxID=7398 RepID=A0A1A9Z0R8_GLOPL